MTEGRNVEFSLSLPGGELDQIDQIAGFKASGDLKRQVKLTASEESRFNALVTEERSAAVVKREAIGLGIPLWTRGRATPTKRGTTREVFMLGIAAMEHAAANPVTSAPKPLIIAPSSEELRHFRGMAQRRFTPPPSTFYKPPADDDLLPIPAWMLAAERPSHWRTMSDADGDLRAAAVPAGAILFCPFHDDADGGLVVAGPGPWVSALLAVGWTTGRDHGAAIITYRAAPKAPP